MNTPLVGPIIGVLMLDTRFPRPPGDIGNPVTFARLGLVARYRRVQGANPARVVRERDPALLEPFVAAARELVAEGATLVTTSCGFLAAFQPALQAALPVPVLTSSLLACAGLDAPGVLTIDADALDARVLAGAGVPAGTPVGGVLPGCEFQRRILGNHVELDLAQAELDVVAGARALVAAHPRIRHIVLECTNMPPYREAVAAATGRIVHSVVDLVARAAAHPRHATPDQGTGARR
ncbi:MAG: aspartate/glutamate racemase family protein [Burkholderiaceae bacterium]